MFGSFTLLYYAWNVVDTVFLPAATSANKEALSSTLANFAASWIRFFCYGHENTHRIFLAQENLLHRNDWNSLSMLHNKLNFFRSEQLRSFPRSDKKGISASSLWLKAYITQFTSATVLFSWIAFRQDLSASGFRLNACITCSAGLHDLQLA